MRICGDAASISCTSRKVQTSSLSKRTPRGVVGAEGRSAFEGGIKSRREHRREKGRRDEKARACAEERERERLPYPAWVEPKQGHEQEMDRDTSSRAVPRAQQQQLQSGAWRVRGFAAAANAGVVVQRHCLTLCVRPRYDGDADPHAVEQCG